MGLSNMLGQPLLFVAVWGMSTQTRIHSVVDGGEMLNVLVDYWERDFIAPIDPLEG